MKASNAQLTARMAAYEEGCVQRVHHLLKVYAFAKTIGELEMLDETERFTLEAAALVHDIGIKLCLEKHGSAAGHLQETEGPPIAEAMLAELGYPEEVIRRVCYLVAHHHTYDGIVGADYQILVEADFLVNIFEGEMSREAAANVRKDIFKTQAGLALFDALYAKHGGE